MYHPLSSTTENFGPIEKRHQRKVALLKDFIHGEKATYQETSIAWPFLLMTPLVGIADKKLSDPAPCHGRP